MLKHVLKLGGSLLDIDCVGQRVQDLVAELQLKQCLIVTGGGAAADVVRHRQTVEHFDDEAAHWEAIAAMSANAERLFANRDGFRMVSNRRELTAVFEQANRLAVLDATAFIRDEEANLLPPQTTLSLETRLRPSWEVTSDSISVWLGLRLGATSVWLLKSRDPSSPSLSELSRTGEIDPPSANSRSPPTTSTGSTSALPARDSRRGRRSRGRAPETFR